MLVLGYQLHVSEHFVGLVSLLSIRRPQLPEPFDLRNLLQRLLAFASLLSHPHVPLLVVLKFFPCSLLVLLLDTLLRCLCIDDSFLQHLFMLGNRFQYVLLVLLYYCFTALLVAVAPSELVGAGFFVLFIVLFQVEDALRPLFNGLN